MKKASCLSSGIKVIIFVTCICLLLSGCEIIQRDSKGEDEKESPDMGRAESTSPDGEKEVKSPEIGDGSEKDHRELTAENIVKLYGETIFRFRKDVEKVIALTFDDGPDTIYTPQILDILKENNVSATFFIIGIRAEENPDILKRIDAEGHEIGHHGYNHFKMSNLTPDKINQELDKVNQILKENLAIESNIFRPPYGAIDPELAETVQDRGDYIILWDIDSLDWRGLKKEEVFTNIFPEIHPGAIILQHSAGGPNQDLTGTVEALKELIPLVKDQGYHFVTISELFGDMMVNK